MLISLPEFLFLVRVILGERHSADTPSDNVYTRAAQYLLLCLVL